MPNNSNGILRECYQGLCANYLPDKTKPTKIKAHNIEGLVIHECLNFEESKKQEEENYCSGQFCSNRQLRSEKK